MSDTYTHLIDGISVTVDRCDAHLFEGEPWRYAGTGTTSYVRRGSLYLHRAILGAACGGLVVDHIDGDTTNNCRHNLRAVTRTENNQNVRVAKRTSKSGLLGANWHKRSKRWRAQLRLNGATVHIGYFDTAEEAHAAYIARKRVLHTTCSI